MKNYFRAANELFEFSKSMRRDFHAHPELGFQEERTSEIIANQLSSLGLDVRKNVGGTGVVGLLRGKADDKVLLLRFDMDALPVNEETGLAFMSQKAGVMHACGHDGHMAIGLTVARILSESSDDLPGNIKFVFQPAEEGLGGAEAMITDRVLEDPAPDYALSLHLWNEKPVGSIALTKGPIMAGSDTFRILLSGTGGHGAAPHLTRDPVLAAAHIITALQTIVSRNVSPLQTVVVSVTKISAGDAHNIIPQYAEIMGTIRTFDVDVRRQVIERLKTIVNGIGSTMGCKCEIDISRVSPPVVNHSHIVDVVVQTVRQNLPEMVIMNDYKTMISEDMGFFLEKIPGCYMLIGSANLQNEPVFGHHHPKFDFDESVMPIASALIAYSSLELLQVSRDNVQNTT